MAPAWPSACASGLTCRDECPACRCPEMLRDAASSLPARACRTHRVMGCDVGYRTVRALARGDRASGGRSPSGRWQCLVAVKRFAAGHARAPTTGPRRERQAPPGEHGRSGSPPPDRPEQIERLPRRSTGQRGGDPAGPGVDDPDEPNRVRGERAGTRRDHQPIRRSPAGASAGRRDSGREHITSLGDARGCGKRAHPVVRTAWACVSRSGRR